MAYQYTRATENHHIQPHEIYKTEIDHAAITTTSAPPRIPKMRRAPTPPSKRPTLLLIKDAIEEGASYNDLLKNDEYRAACNKHSRFIKEYIEIVANEKEKSHLTETVYADFKPRHWQQQLLDILTQDPDPRHVHWIWDTEGNTGKSYMAKYLSAIHSATTLNCTKVNDIPYICSTKMSRIIVFDLPRALEKKVTGSRKSRAPMDIIYNLMTELKDGHISVTKHRGFTTLCRVPHVVVFANFPPNTDKMSKDKWKIQNIGTGE
jgi:hypothetical protein